VRYLINDFMIPVALFSNIFVNYAPLGRGELLADLSLCFTNRIVEVFVLLLVIARRPISVVVLDARFPFRLRPPSRVPAIVRAARIVNENRPLAREHIVRVALLRWLRRGHGVDLGRELGFRSTTCAQLIDWRRF